MLRVARQPRSARANLPKLPLCGAGRFAAFTERAAADQGGSATESSSTPSTRMRPCKSAASYGSFFDNRAECWDHRRMGEALRHPTLRPSGFGNKSRLERLRLDPTQFAGHSLRPGFLTSAAARGASIFKMMDVSRHRSVDTLRGYVRDAELFKDHAGAELL